jgi:nicotinamidase-related amidase
MSEQRDKKFEMKGQYTPENSSLVLIDHQVGTLQFVHTMTPDETLRNAVMLAKAANAYGMPVVLTTSQEDHIQGPTALLHCSKFCRPLTKTELSVPEL